MTIRRNAKRNQLLALIGRGKGRQGIYALARAARRPYRRVYDAVRAFEAQGRVRLVPLADGRRTLAVEPVATAPPLKLEFNRAYSAPGQAIPDETQVALVLAQPSFRDLLACVDRFGLAFVEAIRARMLARDELGASASRTTRMLLDDIIIGRQRRGRRPVDA